MTHYLHKIAFEAEQFLIPPDHWRDHLPHLPEEGRKILQREMGELATATTIKDFNLDADIEDEGIECGGPSGPTGLAKHPKHGYIILGAGQGPFVIWSEKELPE